MLSMKSYPEIVDLTISPTIGSLFTISVTRDAVAIFGGASVCRSSDKGAEDLIGMFSLIPLSTTGGSGGLGEVRLPL